MFVSNIGAKHSVFVFGRLTSQARQRQSRLLYMYITVPVSWGIWSERPKQREVQRQTLAVSEDGKRAQAPTHPQTGSTHCKNISGKICGARALPRLTRSHPGAGKERGKGGPVGRKRRRRFSPGFHFCTLHLSSSSSFSSGGGGGKKKVFKEKREEICMRGKREEGKK